MTDSANAAPQAQLADEELDRLEALLDEPELEEAMRLDEVQGYLIGRPVPSEEVGRFLRAEPAETGQGSWPRSPRW